MPVKECKLNTLLRGFLLLLPCSIIHGSQVRFNPSHYNKVLEGQVMEAKKVPTYSVCVYECMVTTDCQSFNYYMDERLCVFHAENSSTDPQCLFEATGRIRYSDISIWPKVITKQSTLLKTFLRNTLFCISDEKIQVTLRF